MHVLKALAALALPGVIALAQAPEPAKDLSPAYASQLVRKAVAFAKSNGMDKLIEETNRAGGQFHVASGGELYIFIYDQKGTTKAIGFNTEKLVGSNRWDLKDEDGVYFVQELIKRVQTKGRGWVEYKYPNPATHKTELKVSFVEGCQDLVIGSGTYKGDSALPE
jgi:signal transduction histidine kinase